MKLPSLLFAALVSATALFAAEPAARPNILMIAVDDLRPQLGCYGVSHVKSPHIDRLAAGGVRFERAYCMVPTCGASRASLMTSIRPAANRFVTHLTYAEKDAPGITTLNTHLKQNGYTTLSNGKVFHHPSDSAGGWSEPAWRPGGGPAATGAAGKAKKAAGKNKTGKADQSGNERGAPYQISPLTDEELPDGQIAEKTIEDLRRLKAAGKPFFVAAGFMKPHLPFVAPRKYWDLYPPGTVALPATYNRPKDAPDDAIHNFGELRAYAGVPKTGPVSEEMALNLNSAVGIAPQRHGERGENPFRKMRSRSKTRFSSVCLRVSVVQLRFLG